MKELILYAVIKIKVQIDLAKNTGDPDLADNDDIIDAIASHADYNLSLDGDGLKIVDTEFVGLQTDAPE